MQEQALAAPVTRFQAWKQRWGHLAACGPRTLCVSLASQLLARDRSRRMWGHGKVMGIRVKGVQGPVYIRLGTSDLWVLHEVFFEHEYDAVRGALRSPPRTIVDLGSNIGLTIRYWRMLYPEARMAGVEPDASNMSVCERNARAAGGPQTHLVRACVAGTHRKVALDRSAPAWAFKMKGGSGETAGQGEQDIVDALPMLEVLESAGISGEIDLLKCDIEGAEGEVFADCGAWITRVGTLIIELHAPYTLEMLVRDLKKGGFEGRTTQLKRVDNVQVVMIQRGAA